MKMQSEENIRGGETLIYLFTVFQEEAKQEGKK